MQGRRPKDPAMAAQNDHLLLTRVSSFVKDGQTFFVLDGITQRGHGVSRELVLGAQHASLATCATLSKAAAGDYLALTWQDGECQAAGLN